MIRIKVNHWLSLYFLLYGGLVFARIRSARHLVSAFAIGQYPINAPTRFGVNDIVALGMLAVLVGGAIGVFHAKRWGRIFGVYLTAWTPIEYGRQALMFGAEAVFTPISVGFLLMTLAVCWFMCTSKQVKQVYGGWGKHGESVKKNKFVLTVLAGIMVVGAAVAGVLVVQKMKRASVETQWIAPIVVTTPVELQPGFVDRELLNFRVAVPNNMRVEWVAQDTQYILLGQADKKLKIVVSGEPMGIMINDIGKALWIGGPYEIHRHMLRSRWNIVFGVLKSLTLSHFGKRVDIAELQGPGWRGFGVYSLEKAPTWAAEYSFYDRTNPNHAMAYTWRDGVVDKNEFTQVGGRFAFLPETKLPGHYVAEAKLLLAQERLLDAQFALAQAYVLGEQSPEVWEQLVEVSAELESWRFVKLLAKTLLEGDPENSRMEALYKQALKVLEKKQEDSL